MPMAVASELVAGRLTEQELACVVMDSPADEENIARGGLLTLGGSICAGVLGFALTLIVGNTFGAHQAGIFFMAVAIFTILNGIAVAGSDTGLLRSISSRRSLHAHDDVWAAIRLTAGPVLLWSAFLAIGLWFAAGPVSQRLLGADGDVMHTYLQVLSVTLVFSAFGQAALVGSRGFGDLRPYILLYQIGLSATRVVLVWALGMTGGGSPWLVAAWAVPLVIMDLAVIGYVLRAGTERHACPSPSPATPRRQMFREVWRFNVPRGFASLFETCIVWADVLVVGYFLGPAVAGAYAAASRFVTTGTMAMEAMRIGSAPIIAAAFARGQKDRANEAYQLTSVWLVLMSWPLFLMLATFAPFILGLIGDDFVVAAQAMSVMSLGILGYLLMGNINTVVLMAGRSAITATNSFVTVLVNISLNLLLVPTIGLVGAAIAWSVSLTLDSVLCLIRGYRYTGVLPPVGGLAVASAACLIAFGTTGLGVRLLGDQEISWMAAYVLVSVVTFAALLWVLRAPLHLQGFARMAVHR